MNFNPCFEQKDFEKTYHLIAQFIDAFKSTHNPLKMKCEFTVESKLNGSQIYCKTTELPIFQQYLEAKGLLTSSQEASLTI